MSRIGKKPISITNQVTVSVADDAVAVKGPKGEQKIAIPANIVVEVKDGLVMVNRTNDDKQSRASHGLVRSLINNSVIGVTQGYKKVLKMVGTGYRVQAKGANLELSVGFSHPVEVKPKLGVKLSTQGNDTIIIEGAEKQAVGQVSADIRAIRPPEPYKGKGIHYEGEVIRRKAGKTAGA